MAKNKKHRNFGDMPHEEIKKWQNEAPVIVMLDGTDTNDLAFYKTELFTDNILTGNVLMVFQNNTKNKNMSVFSKDEAQRLKQFLNEHF